ncbi:hypothetical protein BDA99DRAFT_272935 [Phascolomyces articulosus]|uniref:Uncharacterized protein n=1 Tax=Phascolomyces articulosus TaxID=60185 RepID=A0AAD5K736_9FUNG|nr:hypothetical protein BDA99DRAFT_272935 [Phascolomyces articulosus]
MDSIKKLSKTAGRNIDSGIDLSREMYKKTIMTGDERNFYCFVHKILEILERHPELFNDEEKKKLTENDYVVRLWAPMLFALFEDSRKLNLTWGESVLRGVGDDSYYKVDLRVTFRHEKQNYVLSTGEFSKSANLGKMRRDNVKLLLEGNMIIDNAKNHHMKPEVSLLQCAGRFYSILNIMEIHSMNPPIHIY